MDLISFEDEIVDAPRTVPWWEELRSAADSGGAEAVVLPKLIKSPSAGDGATSSSGGMVARRTIAYSSVQGRLDRYKPIVVANPIGYLNEWCQSRELALPEYVAHAAGETWVVTCSAVNVTESADGDTNKKPSTKPPIRPFKPTCWEIKSLEYGIDRRVVRKLKAVVEAMTTEDRLCSLMFDECLVQQTGVYDAEADFIVGFSDLGGGNDGRSNVLSPRCLLFMVKTLISNWEFPFSCYASTYDLNSADLHKIIMQNLESLTDIGLIVRTLVCDMEGKNRGLYNLFMLDFFVHEGNNLYLMADYCHCIRSIKRTIVKDNFVSDYGTVSGKIISDVCIIDKYSNFLKFCPKVRVRASFTVDV